MTNNRDIAMISNTFSETHVLYDQSNTRLLCKALVWLLCRGSTILEIFSWENVVAWGFWAKIFPAVLFRLDKADDYAALELQVLKLDPLILVQCDDLHFSVPRQLFWKHPPVVERTHFPSQNVDLVKLFSGWDGSGRISPQFLVMVWKQWADFSWRLKLQIDATK